MSLFDSWKTTAKVTGLLNLAVVAFIVLTWINVWLWANALAPVTGFQTPTFWQMVGIEALCFLLIYPAATRRNRASESDVERARDSVLAEIAELRETITRARA